MKKKNQPRYIAVPGYKGVRKDKVTGKFQARKIVAGKTYTHHLESAYQAIQWRKNFHPLLTNTQIETKIDLLENQPEQTVQAKFNGSNHAYTFESAWTLYDKYYLSKETLPQTREKRLEMAKHFFPDLMNLKMVELTSEFLDHFMDKQVSKALKVTKNKRRKSFDNDLKALKAFCHWYRENFDGQFVCPILKRHYSIGTLVKRSKEKKTKMNEGQLIKFFSALGEEENPIWRDFAETHFFLCGRVQEPAGLQKSSLNFEKEEVLVKDVVIWSGKAGNCKKFDYLKEYPKNESCRIAKMNNRMKIILKRRIRDIPRAPCRHFKTLENGKLGDRLDFVFHLNGEPLSYRAIQYRYNKALRKAGLADRFSATHILRGAAANIVEKNLGKDEAQNSGGWNSRETMEKYYLDNRREMSKEAANCLEKAVCGSEQISYSNSRVEKGFKLTLVKS